MTSTATGRATSVVMTCAKARTYCRSYMDGADLVSVESAEEHNFSSLTFKVRFDLFFKTTNMVSYIYSIHKTPVPLCVLTKPTLRSLDSCFDGLQL